MKKNKEIHFLLNASKPINVNQINIELVSGTNSRTVKPTIIRLKEDRLEIIYKFENKGIYDVHFKMDDNIFLTYVVKVKKGKS